MSSDGIWKFLFLHVIKLKINMVYHGDVVRSKFNHETFQSKFDFGSTRKAIEDFLKTSDLIRLETFNFKINRVFASHCTFHERCHNSTELAYP